MRTQRSQNLNHEPEFEFFDADFLIDADYSDPGKFQREQRRRTGRERDRDRRDRRDNRG